LEVTDIPLA